MTGAESEAVRAVRGEQMVAEVEECQRSLLIG